MSSSSTTTAAAATAEEEDEQFASKLTTAIQRMLDGHLKDNHDDTLFEKLCHFIEHDVPTAKLQEIDLFSLLDQSLPQTASEACEAHERLAMFFRLASAAAAHKSLLHAYFELNKKPEQEENALPPPEPVPLKLIPLIHFVIDKMDSTKSEAENNSSMETTTSTTTPKPTTIATKVTYALCHLLESISSTFHGCTLYFSRLVLPECTNSLGEASSPVAVILSQLCLPTTTIYLREKIINLWANLIQFTTKQTDLFPKERLIFAQQIKQFLVIFGEKMVATKDTSMCNSLVMLLGRLKTLNYDSEPEHQHSLVLSFVFCADYGILSFLETYAERLEPDDNISQLIASVAWAYHKPDGERAYDMYVMDPVIVMIQKYIKRLYDTRISFRLLTFLIDTYGMRYEVGDDTVGQRGFTMKYMHRMISIVGEHNDFVVLESMWNELPSRDKRLIVDTTAFMSYNDFEFNTFRMLNRLGDTGKLSHLFQFDLLTCGLLKALTRLSNEKHLRMLYRFLEGIAHRNRDHECIIGELMFSFTQVLTEQRQQRPSHQPLHVILKIIRVLYPRLGELYTRSFFMHYLTGMLHVCNTRFRRVDLLDEESHELVEMLLESIHQLYLHLDFRAFVNHGQGDNAIEQLIEASNRTIRYLRSFLESESYYASHPIMVTTLHAIEMKAKQENVTCLNTDLAKFDWSKALKDFDQYELTARQTFVLNQKALLEMNPAMRLVDVEEMRFYCRHLVEETDCELQMELIDIVSLLANYRFDIVDTNQELIEWCAQTRVLQLGHDLLAPALTLPRIAALAEKFNENLQEQLLGRSSEEEIRKFAAGSVEPAILEAFFRKLPDKKEKMEVEPSPGGHPCLHLLDDIICAINVPADDDDELVMDCY